MKLSLRLANASKTAMNINLDDTIKSIVAMFSADAEEHRKSNMSRLPSRLGAALAHVAAKTVVAAKEIKRIVVDSSPYSKTKSKPPILDCNPYRKAGK